MDVKVDKQVTLSALIQFERAIAAVRTQMAAMSVVEIDKFNAVERICVVGAINHTIMLCLSNLDFTAPLRLMPQMKAWTSDEDFTNGN